MGESVSTATLTVEDISDKFPDIHTDLKILVPLKDVEILIGETHRLFIQGMKNGKLILNSYECQCI